MGKGSFNEDFKRDAVTHTTIPPGAAPAEKTAPPLNQGNCEISQQ